jgi:hypothetical protein
MQPLLTAAHIFPFLSEHAAESLVQYKPYYASGFYHIEAEDLEAHVATTRSADRDILLD